MPAAAWAAVGLVVSLFASLIAPKHPAVACPPVAAYTLTQEQAMAESLRKLPPDDPLVGFVSDSLALRKSAKACAGK